MHNFFTQQNVLPKPQSMSDSRITVAPTLAMMADIYGLSREGGPRSPRFIAYVSHVEHNWGLSAYNPMAGQAVRDTVRVLIANDAERLAFDEASSLTARCEFDGDITIAIVVPSPGMWTDRLATEIQHRTTGIRRPAHGAVMLWHGDVLDEAHMRHECAAEVVRTMWTAYHGVPSTLGSVLAREGLCYALAAEVRQDGSGASGDDDGSAVEEAIGILGDTTDQGQIAGVLYGDTAAATMGWSPLGLAERAGYRWAIARAREIVRRVGAPAALRDSFPPTPTRS